MTLDEAIKHCEEQANLLEESAAGCDMTDKVEKEIACRSGKCADEHRQLAEWLKELQELKREYTCSECRYLFYGFSDHPCSVCRRGYYPRHSMVDYYEMKVEE